MIVYLDGSYLPADQARVSIFDGGYMYGDGIYTTLRLYAGVPLDLAAHHDRLLRQTAALQIPCSLSLAELFAICSELVIRNGLEHRDSRLRISVSRAGDGADPLPLAGLTASATTVSLTLVPVAPELARWQADGIAAVRLADDFARGNFPRLKTLNALATITALRRAAAAGCQEALLTGSDGRLLEGAVSNIFLVVAGALVTPAGEGAFLAGRTRERILKIAAAEDLASREEVVDQSRLLTADEVFVVSSVREVLPVVRIDGRTVGEGLPGPVTRRLQQLYHALVMGELADR